MLGRVLRAGILAGLCGRFAGFCVQAITVQPLIIAAERHETAGATSHTHTPNAVAAVASVGAGTTPWSPAPGKERTAYALIANLAFGVGFGLLLVAAMTAAGPMTGVRSGMVWGMCGFSSPLPPPRRLVSRRNCPGWRRQTLANVSSGGWGQPWRPARPWPCSPLHGFG